MLILVAACLCAALPAAAQDLASGSVNGRILDGKTGAPLSRVLVAIEGADREALTDDTGRFVLDNVPAGPRKLVVSVVGYVFVRRDVEVPRGGALELVVPLTEGTGTYTESVTVAVDRFHVPDPGVASQHVLGSAEIQNLRGVAADDPLRAVQVLPGVATGDDLRSEFSVRGSGFGHMNLTVDGFASPYLLHTVRAVEDFSQSGSVAMINSDILQDVTLLSGGYAQRYGDRTGGEVHFRLREGSRERTQARLAVSGTSASGVVEGPIGHAGRGSWLASARQSYLHLLIDRLLDEEGLHFKFTDAQAKLVYDVTAAQRAELTMLAGASRFRSAHPDDPDDVFDGTNATAMAIGGWRVMLPRAIVTAKGMTAWNEFANDDAQSGVRLDEGGDRQAAGRLDAASTLGGVAFESGLQIERTWQRRARQRYIRPDYRVINDFSDRGTRAGAYAMARWMAGPLTIAPGVRADRWSATRETTTSPWVQTELRLGERTTVRGGAGVYRQFPALEHVVGHLAAPDTGASRADQFDLGVERRIGDALRVQLTAYARREAGFFRRRGAETRLDAQRVIIGDQRAPYEQRLDGRASGVELLLQRKAPGGLSGWISYAYGRHRRDDSLSAERFWGDLDQRHTFNLYAFYRLSDRSSLSAKLRAGSNTPAPGYFCEVEGGFALSDRRNDYRLPPYSRLDVRANRTFVWGARRLTLFAEVMNVLNRENVRYLPPNLTRAPVRIRRLHEPLMPILPSVGILVEF